MRVYLVCYTCGVRIAACYVLTLRNACTRCQKTSCMARLKKKCFAVRIYTDELCTVCKEAEDEG